MKQFAKLFTDIDGEQILVVLDSTDDGDPAVKFSFDPCVEDLGIATVSIVGEDTDDGWEAVEKTFAAVDEVKARKVILKNKQMIKGSFGDKEAQTDD